MKSAHLLAFSAEKRGVFLSACFTAAFVVLLLQARTIKQLRTTVTALEERSSMMGSSSNEQQRFPDQAPTHPAPQPIASETEKEQLVQEVRELRQRLKGFEPCMPGQEHPESAYVGPGTWINTEPRDSLQQIIISGASNSMTIRATSLNGVAPWEEVPLERALTDANSYWRGVASWGSFGVFVTFEREGLRVDWIQQPKRRNGETNFHYLVSNLKRVQIGE